MMRIQVSTDSVSDLGGRLMERYGIQYMPLMITMGSESLPDGDGMPAKIFEYVEQTGKLPKTATRSVDDYTEFFTKHKPDGGELVHFTISSKISASYDMASAAAAKLEGVYVVDTRSLSTGAGLCVLFACDLAEEGKLSGGEIAEACRARTEAVQASFVLDSLDFLHKGGRCSGLKAFIASVFRIKPMICLVNGEMKVGKKYTGRFASAVDRYVDDILNTYRTPDLKRCFVTYTTLADGMAEHIAQKVKARYPFEEVILTVAGGTITSHCGKNTVGVLYFNDGK
jgi:DegV family protein with EDD domain